MKVQERDLELVRWVNGFGFVEVESVSLFWGVSYDVARARLAKLVKGGLLVSERGLTTGKLVFWPSGEGLELAGDEMRAVKAIRWATAGHDLAVQRLSVRLERETGGRFEPERRLRRRRGMQGVGVVGHVPDGVLHLEAEEARKAEEARREQEEGQRLQEARERASADRYEALLWVHQDAEQAARGAEWQRNQWIEANPWRARLHRWGVLEARPLVEIEGRIEAVRTAQEALQRDPLGRLAYEAREAARRQQEAAQREAERVQREQQRQLERQQRRERQRERGQKPSKDRGGMDFGM